MAALNPGMTEKDYITELVAMGLTDRQISQRTDMSERTIRSRKKEYGIRKQDTLSDLNDNQLDEAMMALLGRHPNFGMKMAEGALRAKDIVVTRDRLRASMRRVDPDGVEARKRGVLHRRRYQVPGPNSLWHIDGNHKLIRWRFVVHAGVDGFSRVPVFIKCSTDNKAETMFGAFREGVLDFGLPERIRSDKGGENTLVCSFMLSHPLRGADTNPFITGRSVHNQRVERFWRDLFTGCLSTFYSLFRRMEETDVLDPSGEADIFALHYVFLPVIRSSIEEFRQSFLHHKVRTENNLTPLQLWQSPVNDGHHIDTITEDDFTRFEGQRGAIDRQNAVAVPAGLQLTEEQQTMVIEQFNMNTVDLRTDDQINYFSGLRQFLLDMQAA